MRKQMQIWRWVMGCVLVATPALGADFYIDPANGAMGNDGSASAPWSTLQEVIDSGLIETQTWQSLPYAEGVGLVPKNAGAPVKSGDTLWLRSGYHGAIVIEGMHNANVIQVRAESGADADIGSLTVRSGSNFVFSGLRISPSFLPVYAASPIVQLQTHSFWGPSSDLVVDNCDIFSVDDISAWTATQWNSQAANGIEVDAPGSTISNNMVRNIDFGISVLSSSVNVLHNTVTDFSGDGLRGLGDYGVFAYNLVKNCYVVNENHDDGFQSWSRGADGTVGEGEVVGVELRGNTILNYEDPNQPLRCSLQGIGGFDGMFRDWIVENNVVIVDHWHAITLRGANNTSIVNNTIVDINGLSPGPPWVSILPHKNGTSGSGNVIANNLTPDIEPAAPIGTTTVGNILYNDATAHFVDPTVHDYRLLAGSVAVDSAVAQYAPGIDAHEQARPQGNGYDVGALERCVGDCSPIDAGPAPDGGSPVVADGGTPAVDGGRTDAGPIDPGPDAGGQSGADAGPLLPGTDAGLVPDGGPVNPSADGGTPCLVGAENCPCTNGGACDGTLECVDALCIEVETDGDGGTEEPQCGCSQTRRGPGGLTIVALLLLWGLRRRRVQRGA